MTTTNVEQAETSLGYQPRSRGLDHVHDHHTPRRLQLRQLSLTIQGEPARVSMCHCLECQRRTGAVSSNQARFRREQIAFAGAATAWTRSSASGNALTLPLLSAMRIHGLLGG